MSDRSSNAGSDDSGNDTTALQDAGAAIKREGRHLAEDAKSTAKRMVADQRDALADYVAALAHAADRGAEDLNSAGYRYSAAAVSRTAGDVGGFAERLQARAPGELWADVEGFARDHRALAFGAGFAAAFGVARFLKSSGESREPETPVSPSADGE